MPQTALSCINCIKFICGFSSYKNPCSTWNNSHCVFWDNFYNIVHNLTCTTSNSPFNAFCSKPCTINIWFSLQRISVGLNLPCEIPICIPRQSLPSLLRSAAKTIKLLQLLTILFPTYRNQIQPLQASSPPLNPSVMCCSWNKSLLQQSPNCSTAKKQITWMLIKIWFQQGILHINMVIKSDSHLSWCYAHAPRSAWESKDSVQLFPSVFYQTCWGEQTQESISYCPKWAMKMSKLPF